MSAAADASVQAPRFPGESPEYRAARERLLRAEIDLRRQTEAVAAQRRGLPPGGPVPEDYVFAEGEDARPVRLSALFGDRPVLMVYSYMYGPAMAQPCPMCTAMLDGLDGQAAHIGRRVALAVVARSPIARIRAFAAERGWSRLRLISSAGNGYNRDYLGETAEGAQLPMLNAFSRGADGVIRHRYATELLLAPSEPGQDSRHVDAIWPLWNMLDFSPEGRGADTYPRLRYD
jgi:predicted dithiol-disulfide oxidoreductase (DUF899 family)